MKSMLSIVLTIGGIYLVLLLLMFLFQGQLLFMPSSQMAQSPDAAGMEAEDLYMETEDGVTIHGWYFPHEGSNQVIVLSHGNAGNISHRLDIAATLLEAGAAVLMYDYRGYGNSEGSPNEDGLYKDMRAVMGHLTGEKGYSEQEVFQYGRSLGGAVAAWAASEYEIGGLVLDSAFTGLRAMVRDVYPFVPSFLARYNFPTKEFIKSLDGVPVMVMHSRNDEIISFSHGEALFEAAAEPKRFVELGGTHNDNFFVSRDLIRERWTEFLEEFSN